MSAKGKCLCGAISLTVDDADLEVHCCHCSMCRRWAGGPVFAVPVAHVTLQPESEVVRYESSEWAERGFCGRCGTNLFYRLKEPDSYYLMMGLFDHPEQFQLASEIYIDNKPACYALTGEHTRLTEEEFLAAFQ